MITNEIKSEEIFYIPITINNKYKYIRYIGPNNRYCIISELEIYGDDELDDDKINNKEIKEEEYYYRPTNIHLMAIQTKESVEPYDKENYISCSVTIIKVNKKDIKEKGKIKLRGNATLRLKKKSFRIKFYEQIRPLGMKAKAK